MYASGLLWDVCEESFNDLKARIRPERTPSKGPSQALTNPADLLPGGHGAETLGTLKRHPPHVTIISDWMLGGDSTE